MNDRDWKPRFTPNPSGLSAEFYAYGARGELRFQRCTGCAAWRHLPRVTCARCGSDGYEWALSSGRGHVYTWTVTHQALLPAFADALPYVVAVIELEEGVRLVSGLRGIGAGELAPDLPVRVGFEKISDTVGLHYFVRRDT